MKAYEQFNLLENADIQGKVLTKELYTIPQLSNVRGIGLLVAFDMDNGESRNNFVENIRNDGMICNPTGEKSVRLRPNLSVTETDIKTCVDIIRRNT
jgi:L-lysine 6-transaminase